MLPGNEEVLRTPMHFSRAVASYTCKCMQKISQSPTFILMSFPNWWKGARCINALHRAFMKHKSLWSSAYDAMHEDQALH